MKISNNGKYWVIQDSFGNEIALFKSLKALTDYVSVTKQIAKMRKVA